MAELVLTHVFCILVLMICLIGINFQRDKNAKASKGFTGVVFGAMFFVVLNLLGEMLDGNTNTTSLTFFVNLLVFLAVDILILCFVNYLAALIGDTSKARMKSLKLTVMLTGVRVTSSLVLAFSGHLFAIENGYYVERNLCFIPYVLSACIMVQLFWAVLKNRDRFTVKQFVVITLYLILPVIPIAIEVSTELYSLTPVAITTSVLLVYVLIQASTIEEGKVRENVLEELSNTDLLTKLLNRRAYYSYISNIEKDQSVGVIFCDVNGLKYTNDHFGHAEGDKLLQSFAELLLKSFRSDEVFRISGDEFVVMMAGITGDIFEKRVEEFRSAVEENNNISAVGSAFGAGRCLERLVSEAEERMYTDKKEKHQIRGEK